MNRVRLHPACRTPILLLISVARSLAQDPGAAPPYEGRRISAVIYDPAVQPLDPRDLAQAVALKAGMPLTLTDVRLSIERMYASGRYEYVEIDGEPSGADVAIRITTRNNWFIGHVSVQGVVGDPPNPGQIVNATDLDLGQPFHAEDIKTAEEKVRKLLIANGFYEATVTSVLDYSKTAEQVDVRFLVFTGHRARFWIPQLTGNVQLPERRVIKATKWKRWFNRGWEPITQTRVREGLDGVRKKFEKSDRLLATVQLQSLIYDAENLRATPTLAIEAGPQVSINVLGAKLTRKKLEANIPVYQEHTVDNDLLEEGKQNLKEEFQAGGYFDAEVEFTAQGVRDGKQEIDYTITPGARHRFVKLAIEGNTYFPTEAIRERLFLAPKSLQFRRGRFSQAFVRRDEESIRNLYRSNGFRDVLVATETEDAYNGREGDVAATIRITEGPQFLVSKLTIEGVDRLNLDQIRTTLSSAERQPFSEYSVASDRETLIAYYFENGFPSATFEYSASAGAKPTDVELTYHIAEGKRQFVRQVITSGLGRVRQSLVDRQISLTPDGPLSPVQMSNTQRRLYDLGVFAKVDMAVQDPDGDNEHKYVVYDMEEARRYSVTTGFGAQLANIGGSNAATSLSDPAGSTGFSPRVSLDATRLDVLGLGHTVSFRSRYSSLDRRALIDYLAPKPFDLQHFDVNFTILYDDAHDVRTFTAVREEASAQLTQHISKSLTGFYRFTYRNVNVGDLKISPLLLPHVLQSVRVGMLSANFIQDRRDDPTDAHKGMYNTLEVGLASGAFGSQSDFVRILARNATYHRVTKKLVLARQTSFGVEPAFKVAPGTDPTDSIALPERFYGGGGNSIRGFPENQAGPRDPSTGFPLGGSALFFNTTEFRFPLLGENVGGVLFHDMGNVFDKLSDMSLRFHQNSLTDFNYAVQAVGGGVRYRTPIGPIRLDLAYSVNAPRFNGFSGTYADLVQCSVNNSCVYGAQRVSRFQFFFSIGQAF